MDTTLIDMPPPPIQSIAGWWPLIGMAFSMLIAAGSAAFTAWRELRMKRIDKETEEARQKQAVEIEEVKLTFKARQEQIDNLMNQVKALSDQNASHLEEGRKMREELAKARTELLDRDRTISELRATVAEMQIRIKQLEKEVTVLENKQAAHESAHREPKP